MTRVIKFDFLRHPFFFVQPCTMFPLPLGSLDLPLPPDGESFTRLDSFHAPDLSESVRPVLSSVTHRLLVRYCLLCGDWTAYCTDMGSCERGLPFLEPFEFLLVSMRPSDGGLPI